MFNKWFVVFYLLENPVGQLCFIKLTTADPCIFFSKKAVLVQRLSDIVLRTYIVCPSTEYQRNPQSKQDDSESEESIGTDHEIILSI